MSTVNQGDVVQVHYTGRLENGTVFDSSREREPLEFVAGGGGVIEGVSQAVLGMSEGESKTVTVPADQAYGARNESLKQTVSRNQLPEGVNEGDQLRAVQGEQEIPVWVRKLDNDSAIIDANHPLAGQTLTFDLELVSIQNGQ